jgi:hypothetical protein
MNTIWKKEKEREKKKKNAGETGAIIRKLAHSIILSHQFSS